MLLRLFLPKTKDKIITKLIMTESLSLESANPFAVSASSPRKSVVKAETIKNARLRTKNVNDRFLNSVKFFLSNHLQRAKNTAKSVILITSLIPPGMEVNMVAETISITSRTIRNIMGLFAKKKKDVVTYIRLPAGRQVQGTE